MTDSWAETTSIGTLRSEDLGKPAKVFRYNRFVYRTNGVHLSNGGMGTVYELERRDDATGAIERVVGKVFHSSYLYQLRTDEVTRRDHHNNLAAMARIAAIEHPNILPTYVSAPIGDNYLFVTPRMGMTLLEAITKHNLTARARAKLLVQALEGLSTLHAARLIHRDFTLRNILVDDGANVAYLFDFDLSMSLDDIGNQTYRSYYKGRIFGSPGWSVAPETIDQALMDSNINTSLDVYAIGGALHGLFTEQLLYGPADDMWALLIRIAEGVVIGGRSKVFYPDAFPVQLKGVIEGCLERDPAQRFPSVQAVMQELRSTLRELPDERPRESRRRAVEPSVAERARSNEVVVSTSSDPSITREIVESAERAVYPWGYNIDRSLGRARTHPIFLAVPRPDMVQSGSFPDANVFPKLVTVIDLTKVADPRKFVEDWQQYFWPILKKVRTGLMTSLHKVIYDADSSSLLLFSEFVDEPRFGDRIAELDLHMDGALALGFLVTRQVAGLHEHKMAHNNISPNALLFKGVPATRMVMPAMIGLVEPAMGADAMANDCRALAGMVLQWLRPNRVVALHIRVKPMFEAMRNKLNAWAFDKSVRTPTIDELLSLISDALALVDFNFSVLRDSGGDLQEYALLLISLRLYHLLWPTTPAARPSSTNVKR
ncbi:MAG: protein kinase [Deltaproteobacteria bacterium]|nr:protein kinase [Deltaproteobacteria bacterium]MCW5801000.1 protein kinase [Deltaproteobacteria bacterium]